MQVGRRWALQQYRRPFTELANAFDVEFQYADARITNKQLLDKITEMIVSARFSLFDVTRWNANVTLELGRRGGRRPYDTFEEFAAAVTA